MQKQNNPMARTRKSTNGRICRWHSEKKKRSDEKVLSRRHEFVERSVKDLRAADDGLRGNWVDVNIF